MIPMTAPKRRITDSERIIALIWRRYSDGAQGPISWVRSNTDSMSVLT
jgi:hypothetical protein